jgi:hypothetical protein
MSGERDRISSWHDTIRDDFIRFMQVLRSMDEIREALKNAYIMLELSSLKLAVPLSEHRYTLNEEFAKCVMKDCCT